MPLNATPPSINRANLLHKQAIAREKALVDYALWGGLVDNNLGDLNDLNDEGVVGFKGFMSNSGVDFARIDDDILFEGLRQSIQLGNVIGVHAENEYVTQILAEQLRAQGRVDRAAWSESRPAAAELEALSRAIYWAGVTRGNLHIVHTTIADGIRAVDEARRRGVHVTVETCPHYLFFDQDDFERLGPVAKCAPPIRSRAQVEELWACVLDGMVDTIASDHSPCLWADKEAGMDDIWQAWGGISGIQSLLPVMLTEGVHRRGLALTDLVRMTSANPARIFGLYPTKGSLLPGADADFVVIDLEKEWGLSADDLFYKNKHSPYISSRFKGLVERTVVRGTTVYQQGSIRVDPGYGRLLRRSTPYGQAQDKMPS
jgi:allantoinase